MPKTHKPIKTPVFLRLEPETRERLQRLSYQHGKSVAHIVRGCVDLGLPLMEKRLAESSRKQLQDMIDKITETQRRLAEPIAIQVEESP